jgi:hypothetical protein
MDNADAFTGVMESGDSGMSMADAASKFSKVEGLKIEGKKVVTGGAEVSPSSVRRFKTPWPGHHAPAILLTLTHLHFSTFQGVRVAFFRLPHAFAA